MNTEHPITPPPELVQQWLDYPWGLLEQASITITTNRLQNVATQSAQWGADQELEACIANINTMYGNGLANWLRSMRRAKPPSLKEQALTELEEILDELHDTPGSAFTTDAIRRALESLDD